MASGNTSRDASQALTVRQKVSRLLNAARDGDLELLKKTALEIGEGQSLAETIAAVKDANGRGALHFAAREGKTHICKYLVEELKLPVDSGDENGETPLVHAARQGHFETSKYLLDLGANPLAASNELGTTALHHAAATDNTALIELLLAKGVPIDIASDAGTPLIWAAGHDKPEAVKTLLDHGADPNAETDDNVTALLSAAAAGSLGSVELLVKAGAHVNVHAGGATPMHIAADNGNVKMITCLLDAGADPNTTDEENLKPIQVAAAKGNRAIVEILFPLTSPDTTISDWSVDGILAYGEQMISKENETHGELNKKPKSNEVSTSSPKEVSPEKKKKSMEAKLRGDEAFKKKDYLMAVDAYTQAIDLDPSDGVLFSNRSICWIRLGQAEQALADAKTCRALRPDWAKGCYREGTALRLLQRFDEAAQSFYEGVKLDPENKELVDAFREAVEAGKKFHGTG
eukprot:TRINITY_DN15015_c0_g2_i1.p1 TRINITY_DN15015_c0_g2~~TRINITY_DN15015_c0_g2_i1.p1  ORF type:complete len:461 (-),score=133.94 TRINITY_DN15015_c0_g2_i1:57-1439(-)